MNLPFSNRQPGGDDAGPPMLFQGDVNVVGQSGRDRLPGSEGSEQIDNERGGRRYPPGDLAIWIFILAELLVFAIFFAVYAFTRMQHVELFDQYQRTLDRNSALINTLALLTSSYFVVRGVARIRDNDALGCAKWLWAAVGMGLLFVVVKSAEYAHHFGAGINLRTNTFYMFYLSLTFFHFMHVLLGMVILAAVAFKARAGGYSDLQHDGVESGASYWHMVDMVWLILFPLVYVMR